MATALRFEAATGIHAASVVFFNVADVVCVGQKHVGREGALVGPAPAEAGARSTDSDNDEHVGPNRVEVEWVAGRS